MGKSYSGPKRKRTPLHNTKRWSQWEPASVAARHNTLLAEPVTGWVYVIGERGGSQIKVGLTTKTPKERLAQLQTGSPVQLHVLASWRTEYLANAEALMHAALAPWRLKGEWFGCEAKLAKLAWAKVRNVWPERVNSPQAWEAAHIEVGRWAARKVEQIPKPPKPVPNGVHIPPLGPPILKGRAPVLNQKQRRRKYQGSTKRKLNTPWR